MKEWEKEGRKEGKIERRKEMSHSDIKYFDIYSELFWYISDIKLVPIIHRRLPNVHSQNGNCSFSRLNNNHTSKTVYAKGVASMTDTVASPARLNIDYLIAIVYGRFNLTIVKGEATVHYRRDLVFNLTGEATVSGNEATPYLYTV